MYPYPNAISEYSSNQHLPFYNCCEVWQKMCLILEIQGSGKLPVKPSGLLECLLILSFNLD